MESQEPKPEIAFIDDNAIFRMGWSRALSREFIVHEFESPREFKSRLSQTPELVNRLRAVITDFYFDDAGDSETGLELARETRERGFQGLLLLASDAPQPPEEIRESGLDGQVEKTPLKPGALQKLLGSRKRY